MTLQEPAVRQAADLDLAERCRQQDVSAYEQFFRLYGGRMKSVAWNLLGNREDAEDAVQDTFMKVFRSVEGFQGQAAFSTWVFRILVNTCRDAIRTRGRRAEEPEQSKEIGAQNNPVASIALERALKKLNPRQREVFLLADSEGFSHAEIAAMLDIPEGTSRGLLCEARRALRLALTEGK